MRTSPSIVLFFGGTLVTGLLASLLGAVYKLFWLQIVGLVLLGPSALLFVASLPYIAFAVFWVTLHYLPVLFSWFEVLVPSVFDRLPRERGTETPVPVEGCYRLFVTRRAVLASASELVEPLLGLVRELQRLNANQTELYDAAPEPERVLSDRHNRIAVLVAEAALAEDEREPNGPTHRLLFTTRTQGAFAVRLWVTFVVGENVSTYPGLHAELHLAPRICGINPGGQGTNVAWAFSRLVDTFRADFGHVEVPGEVAGTRAAFVPQVGWLTFVAPSLADAIARLPEYTVGSHDWGAVVTASPAPSVENREALRALLVS